MDQLGLGQYLATGVEEGLLSFRRVGRKGILLQYDHAGGSVYVERDGKGLAIVCRDANGNEFSRTHKGAARLYLVANCSR